MCTTPVLVMSDFHKTFVVESDALGTGIGTILTQEGRPLAFTSQYLSGRNRGRSTYEKYMLAILHVVHTLSPTFWDIIFRSKKITIVWSIFWSIGYPPLKKTSG